MNKISSTDIDRLISDMEDAHFEWARALGAFGPISTITAEREGAYIAARDAVIAAVHED